MIQKATKMKGIGILEENKIRALKENIITGLYLEKLLVEDNFDWLNCGIDGKKLVASGVVRPKGCKDQYKILVHFSPFLKNRPDRIWVMQPDIPYNRKIHMYGDRSLCLYYPGDIPPTRVLHLVDMIPWTSEWLIKYEFWKKYSVWLGEEVKH